MEETDVHRDKRLSEFPVWIVEYVWAHRTMDLQQVLGACPCPPVDPGSLRLDVPWRLRVASAQCLCLVKNRKVEHYERVVHFLDATYKLRPQLVSPIKHMKITFGLKTMVVMWMLRENRGMIDTVFKITNFFPRKLPQYQHHCNRHEMFLMRKNHQDFKALAQTLTVDQDKREDYMKRHLEEQYGERYAQKVEERLLRYLLRLEDVLPAETFIDRILRKNSPVTEEEKLLLDVVASDSVTMATALKKLLHGNSASCRPATVSPSSPSHGETETSSPGQACPQARESVVVAEEAESEQSREEPEARGRSLDGVSSSSSAPQFCSKHQRWVETILQECPPSPPPALRSSSSSSSQDLTPSHLVPPPADRQSPTAREAESGREKSKDQRSVSPLVTCPNPSTRSTDGQVSSSSPSSSPPRFLTPPPPPPRCRASQNENSSFVQLEILSPNTTSQSQTASCHSRHPPSPSRLHRKCGRTLTSVRQTQASCPSSSDVPRPGTSKRTRPLPRRDVPLRLSLQTQMMLLRSFLLQPVVVLTRLSAPPEEPSGDASGSLCLDVNALYSSGWSSGDTRDSVDWDPDYRPSVRRRRLCSEFESWNQL